MSIDSIAGSPLYRGRRFANALMMTLAMIATGIGLMWLLAILGMLLFKGVTALNLDLITAMTPPPGAEGGGLLNAIFGSVIMTGLAMLIGTPVGLLAGTWLAEYGRKNRLAEVIRFINDVLLSAPSIIVGLFIYELLVVRMGHFSALAGAVSLAVIVVPVVVRTSEDMLRLVPDSIREAAAALGAPRWKVITLVSYKAARSGLVTGGLLAFARISGETAPLLFTNLNNQFWSSNLNAPMANLPVTIFQFALSPYENWQRLAWAGSLLITIAILGLNILARALSGAKKGTR